MRNKIIIALLFVLMATFVIGMIALPDYWMFYAVGLGIVFVIQFIVILISTKKRRKK